jgi:putative nucleotidyltransferase with HDIG domain
LHLGLVLIYGPVGALVGAAAESIGSALRFRVGWFRFVFNFANNFLTDVAAWAVFTSIERLPFHGVVVDGAAGMTAGLAQWTVNYALLSAIVAIATRRSFVGHLRSSLSVAAYNLVYGYAAVGFVGLHQRYGAWGVTFALAPVVGLQVFLVFLAERTRTHEEHRNVLLGKVTEQAATIERSYDATLIALTHALDARDKETEGHSRRVVEYTRLVAIELGIAGDDLKLLCHGALLHDIGKIGVPDAILHKPGKLTEEEWQIMRRHVEMGARMVEDVDYLVEARRIILHHHERWDGRGYPLGLKGAQIALGARAFAVADAVDAMTQDRPYRRRVSFDEARDELVRYRGTQFDPVAVDAFLALSQERLLAIAALRASAGLDMFSGRNFEPGSRITPRVAIVA